MPVYHPVVHLHPLKRSMVKAMELFSGRRLSCFGTSGKLLCVCQMQQYMHGIIPYILPLKRSTERLIETTWLNREECKKFKRTKNMSRPDGPTKCTNENLFPKLLEALYDLLLPMS